MIIIELNIRMCTEIDCNMITIIHMLKCPYNESNLCTFKNTTINKSHYTFYHLFEIFSFHCKLNYNLKPFSAKKSTTIKSYITNINTLQQDGYFKLYHIDIRI